MTGASLVGLGANVAQVSVPVTYRYHIHLRDEWQMETAGARVIVHAPAIRAALPPAIHTDEMKRFSIRGWARLSPTELAAELERQITPRLSALAEDPRRLQLVRLWLEREHQRGASGFNQIQVKFADETALPPAPTLKLL